MNTPILSFENVTGRHHKFHLRNISFELMPGYICGLMGENGAGKTTLMNYILRENSKYEGRICIEGKDIRENHAQIMNKIGFVSEDNQFFEDRTCRQNAEILGILFDDFNMEKFSEEMESMKLSPCKTYKKMSRGERLKFQLAFAIAHSPCLYLLDEATAGMDPVFRIEFFDILQQIIMDESASVLMTSHISSEIEMKADYVGIMEKGRLILAITMILFIMPCQLWEGDYSILLMLLDLELIGMEVYLKKYCQFKEDGRVKNIYQMLQYLPVSHKQLGLYRVKKLVRLCTWLSGIAVVSQAVFATAFMHTFSMENILIPFVCCFLLPVIVLGSLAFFRK